MGDDIKIGGVIEEREKQVGCRSVRVKETMGE